MKTDPLGEPRNPWHVYLLFVATLNGLSAVTGNPTSAALADSLRGGWLTMEGLLLFFGGFFVLTGMYWQGRAYTGLLIKRLGYVTLIVATMVLSVSVVSSLGFRGLGFAMIAIGFAGISGRYFLKIHRRIQVVIEAEKAHPGDRA